MANYVRVTHNIEEFDVVERPIDFLEQTHPNVRARVAAVERIDAERREVVLVGTMRLRVRVREGRTGALETPVSLDRCLIVVQVASASPSTTAACARGLRLVEWFRWSTRAFYVCGTPSRWRIWRVPWATRAAFSSLGTERLPSSSPTRYEPVVGLNEGRVEDCC